MALKDAKDVSKVKSRTSSEIFKTVMKNTLKKTKKFVKTTKLPAVKAPKMPKVK